MLFCVICCFEAVPLKKISFHHSGMNWALRRGTHNHPEVSADPPMDCGVLAGQYTEPRRPLSLVQFDNAQTYVIICLAPEYKLHCQRGQLIAQPPVQKFIDYFGEYVLICILLPVFLNRHARIAWTCCM